MKTEKMVAPLLWVVLLIVAILAICGLATTLDNRPYIMHLLIAILVLTICMIVVTVVHFCMGKGSADNYEVNDAEKGKENNAFDDETKKTESGGPSGTQQSSQQNGSSAQSNGGGDEKWMNNYVPFNDYPKGNIVYVKE